MKNMLPALLVAAGILIFYSCDNDKRTAPGETSREDLLIGRWKLDSIDISNKTDAEVGLAIAYLLDNELQFDFDKNGTVTEYGASGDSTTASFKWQNDNTIVVEPEDPDIFTIKKLDAANLVLTTEDTVVLFFKRVK